MARVCWMPERNDFQESQIVTKYHTYFAVNRLISVPVQAVVQGISPCE